MTKISCFIITKNAEKTIESTIKSICNISNEIIIIDAGSTDKTASIALSLGANLVQYEGNRIQQKIYGESLCKYDWILNIESHEEITKDLEKEITMLCKSNMIFKYKAYRINFVALSNQDKKPRFLAPENKHLRFYNKNYVSFSKNTSSKMHEDCALDRYLDTKDIYNFINKAYNKSCVSIASLVDKSNIYSSEQANNLYQNSRKISSLRMISEFPILLFKTFFIRRYFVFGFEGFVYSSIFAFSRFLRISKLRELESNNNIYR